LANEANFPGASYYSDPVPPNVWTPVTFQVTPDSPQNVTYEGSNYSTIFSAIGHIQFGVNIPASLKGGATPFTFDLDHVVVSTVPEPATGLLGAAAAAAIAFIQRRRAY
jgi:MYXO-CTERM domain-containing protein